MRKSLGRRPIFSGRLRSGTCTRERCEPNSAPMKKTPTPHTFGAVCDEPARTRARLPALHSFVTEVADLRLCCHQHMLYTLSKMNCSLFDSRSERPCRQGNIDVDRATDSQAEPAQCLAHTTAVSRASLDARSEAYHHSCLCLAAKLSASPPLSARHSPR